MRYYIVVGEASGDVHAANLMAEIKKIDSKAEFRGFGGERMKAEGMGLKRSLSDLAFMGFVEVIKNLRTILGNLSACKEDILEFKPDKLILVDYPGFNLRVAKWAKTQSIPVTYYISPQVWAWKESRVKTIRKVVDRMMVILPFEKEFYAKHDFNVDFVGHPLIDEIKKWNAPQISKEEKVIALLPGSREQEIAQIMSVMLEVTIRFPHEKFVIGKAAHIPDDFYRSHNLNSIEVSSEGTYSLLSRSKMALVTSGTATLETALFKVPQVVCYKSNGISYQLAKRLIRVPYISLVNLVMDRECVPELIQDELNVENLKTQIEILAMDSDKRQKQLKDYQELEQRLGSTGASARAAQLIDSQDGVH